MGRVEVDWEWFLEPLEWSNRKAKGKGFWKQFGLLVFGLGYLLALTAFLVVMVPILWIWEQVK